MIFFEGVGFGRKEQQFAIFLTKFFYGCFGVTGLMGENIFEAATVQHIVYEGVAADSHVGIAPDEVGGFEFRVLGWQFGEACLYL